MQIKYNKTVLKYKIIMSACVYAKFVFVCKQYIHVVTTIVKLLIRDQMEINFK